MDKDASLSRDQSTDYQRQHSRDVGKPHFWTREDQEEETPDGDSSSHAEVTEVPDSEPSSVPQKKYIKGTWIARSPTFHGEYHYEIGFDFA